MSLYEGGERREVGERRRAESPPRIPVTDQRLIRLLGLAALVGAVASAALVLNVDPISEQVAGLAVSLLFGVTLSLIVAPILLIESYRRHPGQWRGRRRRAIRRALMVGLLAGGYSAFRVVGLGSPTGLLIAVLMAIVIEAALTRADNDSI